MKRGAISELLLFVIPRVRPALICVYAFKSRGFGGETGLVTANTASISGLSDILHDNISRSFGNRLERSASIDR